MYTYVYMHRWCLYICVYIYVYIVWKERAYVSIFNFLLIFQTLVKGCKQINLQGNVNTYIYYYCMLDFQGKQSHEKRCPLF